MPARKRWRVVYVGSTNPAGFKSERLAYDLVEALRTAWAESAAHSIGSLTVQVDEGFGWQDYEHIDFATEEAA